MGKFFLGRRFLSCRLRGRKILIGASINPSKQRICSIECSGGRPGRWGSGKNGGWGLTSLDLQRGRCMTSGDGSYRCIERGRWQALGRPNLKFAPEHQGEATEILYCASLLTDEAQDNKCMSREEAVKGLKRCTPVATPGFYRCHSVEYWLKSILISNLSGSESTQSYTNEPIENPEAFECRPQAEGACIAAESRVARGEGPFYFSVSACLSFFHSRKKY